MLIFSRELVPFTLPPSPFAQTSIWEKKPPFRSNINCEGLLRMNCLLLFKKSQWIFRKVLQRKHLPNSTLKHIYPSCPSLLLKLHMDSWGQNLAWTVNSVTEAKINSTKPTQIFRQQKCLLKEGKPKGYFSFFREEWRRKKSEGFFWASIKANRCEWPLRRSKTSLFVMTHFLPVLHF